jgi:diamine N-acetyltransferase
MNGSKVRLRALEPEDVEILYKWENDHTIWHLSSTITPLSRFTLEQYVLSAGQDIYSTRQMRMMVDLNEARDGIKTIGSVDLFEFEPAHLRAGVGILIHKDFRGQGFASEALDLLIDYSMDLLQLHQLFANISPENTESIRLFETKGFQFTGTKKDWNRIRNRWHDENMYQLILKPDNH